MFWVWSFRHKKILLERLGDKELISRLTGNVSQRRQFLKAMLVILAFTILVLALSNPQIGTRLEEVERKGVDIFVALDVSKSMLAEDIAPNRFEKAKHEIASFINKLQGDRIGLIVFSGLAFVQCPLTLDYNAARLFLRDVEVGMIPQPGTAISEAIKTATRSFVIKELKHKVLIIITDGEAHEGDPLAVAKEAAKEGVIIYTIGIGSPKGAPIPEYDQYKHRVGYKKDLQGHVIITKLDIPTLDKIALETEGKFFVANAANSELDKVFNEITDMEKKMMSSRKFTQFEDQFQIFLLGVLVLLICEFLFSERRSVKKIQRELKTF